MMHIRHVMNERHRTYQAPLTAFLLYSSSSLRGDTGGNYSRIEVEADAGARTVQWPPSCHMMKARGGWDVVMGARGGVTVSVGLISSFLSNFNAYFDLGNDIRVHDQRTTNRFR
eukprot:scaffold9514_cov60-Cyclotella_meneghiniana.AAC.4